MKISGAYKNFGVFQEPETEKELPSMLKQMARLAVSRGVEPIKAYKIKTHFGEYLVPINSDTEPIVRIDG